MTNRFAETDHPRTVLLRQLLAGDVAINQVLTGLTVSHLTAIPVVGDWSIRDVMAHCIAHEQLVLIDLRAAQGKGPALSAYGLGGLDAFNNGAVLSMRSLEPRMVVAAWRTSRQELMAMIQSLPDEAFEPGGDLVSRLGRSVGDEIASKTYEHWALHIADIRRGLGAPPL
ncbi:MAG TPA: DinB family protein [Thermomicrobiales bacterium]|jgi:hypothetical protein|nr:DinB family protein [Thermomicrobiales bacterium]